MVRKGIRIMKMGSGGAVSLYLPADVRRLHDLAIMDPDITPSNVYAMALRSVLGESEERHPMELMMDQQRLEVEDMEQQLSEAQSRLSSTESRLPLELARADWLRHLIGRDALLHMKRLRVFLFFDAKASSFTPVDVQGISTVPEFTRPRNGKEAIQEYRELLAKYESTKRGPVAGEHCEVKEHYHPPHLFLEPRLWCTCSPQNKVHECPSCSPACLRPGDSSSIPACAESASNRMGGCDLAQGGEGRCQGVVRHSYIEDETIERREPSKGTVLCDDLKYRCEECWKVRRAHNAGFDAEGRQIPVLKPHWEIEELTTEQTALVEATGGSRGYVKLAAGTGYLEQEKSAFRTLRRKAIISWANTDWETSNPDDANVLSRLIVEREAIDRCSDDDCSRCRAVGKGHLRMTWSGLPPDRPQIRKDMLRAMTFDERIAYDAELKTYSEMMASRSAHIEANVKDWDSQGQPWPFQRLEDAYDDETLATTIDEDIREGGQYSIAMALVKGSIDFDLSTLGAEAESIPAALLQSANADADRDLSGSNMRSS